LQPRRTKGAEQRRSIQGRNTRSPGWIGEARGAAACKRREEREEEKRENSQADDAAGLVAGDVEPGAGVDERGIPALQYAVGVGQPLPQRVERVALVVGRPRGRGAGGEGEGEGGGEERGEDASRHRCLLVLRSALRCGRKEMGAREEGSSEAAEEGWDASMGAAGSAAFELVSWWKRKKRAGSCVHWVQLWAVKSAQLQYSEDEEGEGPKCDAYPAGVPLILCTYIHANYSLV